LQYAGLLNPLDAPHHMRIDEVSPYREGVVLNRPVKENRGSFVDCGMRKVRRGGVRFYAVHQNLVFFFCSSASSSAHDAVVLPYLR
jgi:predicted SPOUT superfamily RNA methylase MTH1